MIATILFALATLAYIGMIFPIVAVRGHGPTHDFSGLFLTPVFWLALSGALSMAIASGAFDWMFSSRGMQYLLAWAAPFAMCVVAVFSVILADESRMPIALRYLIPWFLYLVPLAALFGCFCALYPDLGRSMNPLLWRASLLFSCGLSLLVGCAMTAEFAFAGLRRQDAAIDATLKRDTDRNQQMLAEVEAMQPEKDFGELLQHSNRWERADIQTLAVRKALAHPNFTNQLAENLRTDTFGRGMYFVDAHDPPDPKAIAEPFRDGILFLALDVRKKRREWSYMFADTFDTQARQITSGADRLALQGVDFVPAILEYRAAMDEPRADGVKQTCRAELDKWLKAHKKDPKR